MMRISLMARVFETVNEETGHSPVSDAIGDGRSQRAGSGRDEEARRSRFESEIGGTNRIS